MGQVGEHNTLPLGAKDVHILLVDHDTDSLMFLAFKFEQQSYRGAWLFNLQKKTKTFSTNFLLFEYINKILMFASIMKLKL